MAGRVALTTKHEDLAGLAPELEGGLDLGRGGITCISP